MAVDFNDPAQVEQFKKKAFAAGKDPARVEKYINLQRGTRTVKQGETLSGIAKETGVPVETIAQKSGIKDPDIIQAGQEVKIPKPQVAKMPKTTGATKVIASNEPLRITQHFGEYNPSVEKFSGGKNLGADFGVKANTPLKAPPGEWVVVEAWGGARPNSGYLGNPANRGYGNRVVIKNRKTGEQLSFAHLNRVGVRPGETIQGGEIFGLSGHTGNSTGAHASIMYINPIGQIGDVLKSPYGKFI